MVLQQAFNRLHRNIWIVFCPIILDAISLLTGWYFIGFSGESRLSWRIILEMGMPSLSHLLNTPIMANQIEFLNNPGNSSFAWIAVALILLASAYVQGGFISLLKGAADGEKTSFVQFIRDGRKYWVRFIGLYVMVMLAKVAVTSILVMLFGVAGVLASLMVFVALRILFIYLEFTIVVDSKSIDHSLRQSRHYLKLSIPRTFTMILFMFLFSGALSVLIHWIWLPVTVITGIAVYAYLMTAIQLAFMIILSQAREMDEPAVIIAA